MTDARRVASTTSAATGVTRTGSNALVRSNWKKLGSGSNEQRSPEGARFRER